MKITSLTLVGFKRFRLNQIYKFVIKPTERIQLILGTNGSGKSSLFEELTPLPANHSNYLKNGYKIIEILHNGSHYILTNSFGDDKHHSFVKDNIELYKGSAVSVFRDLVKSEFGITPDIHALMIGAEKFTQMSPSRRREWFTELGEINYDYSIKVYNKLKEKLRDTIGALKNAKERLVIQTDKLIGEEEQNRITAEVNDIHSILTSLLESRPSKIYEQSEGEREWIKTEDKIKYLSTLILKIQLKRPSNLSAKNYSEVCDFITLENENISRANKELSELMLKYVEIEKTYQLLVTVGGKGINEVLKKIEPLNLRHAEIIRNMKFNVRYDNPELIVNLVNNIDDILYNLIPELPINSDKRYSVNKLETEKKNLLILQEKKLELIKQIETSKLKHLHLKQHRENNDISCPKCNFAWKLGFDDETFNNLSTLINDLETSLESINKQILVYEEKIREIIEYGRKYREILNVIVNSVNLKDFWTEINVEDLLINNPREILSNLNILKEDLSLWQEYINIDTTIKEINEVARALKNTETTNLEEVKTKLDIEEKRISNLDWDLHNRKRKLAEVVIYRNNLDTTFQLETELRAEITSSNVLSKDRVDSLAYDTIMQCVRNFQSYLAIKEKQLSEINLQKNLVNNLKETIISLEKDREALKLLVDNLSPTDGLIAEGLFGFIRSFVSQMNKSIKKLWSYPLDIVPCGMNDDGSVELDYRFPMLVGEDADQVPDVSKGSSGMREIIDLAFKWVAAKYLNMNSYPFFMDEFGNTFDAVHKVNSLNTIKGITEQEAFSQVFLISHFENSYGAFTNSETCVLCSNNIILPNGFDVNKHVTID